MKIFILILFIVSVGFCKGEICGGTYRGFQYTITSPNYPNDYPNLFTCTYNLQGEESAECEQEFHLQFQDFNLQSSNNCETDYLKVGDRHVFCGNVTGLRKFIGKNNSLVLVFRSDESNVAKGFKILVTALPCSLKLNPLKNVYAELPTDNIESNAYRHEERRKINSDSSSSSHFIFPANNDDGSSSITQSVKTTKNKPPSYITSYIFLPPKEKNFSEFNTNSLIPPSNNFIPPSTKKAQNFNANFQSSKEVFPSTSWDKSSSVVDQSKKLIPAPSRINGDTTFGVVDYDLQVGNDCDKNTGYLQQSFDNHFTDLGEKITHDTNKESFESISKQGSSGNLIYDPRQGLINSNNYQPYAYSGVNYPTDYQNPNLYGGVSQYNYRPINYPNRVPDYSTAYYGNNLNYNVYSGLNSGFNLPSEECCRIQPSRRFLLVSPGFPGSVTSTSNYACRYTITKSAPDVCRLKLNFRFFNFGAEDSYCRYGYVEIDGRRLCGCKSNQYLQIPFTNDYIKSISVVHSGYPRTKFNGFLIDVIQESCGTSGLYPSNSYLPSSPCPSNPLYPTYPSYNQIPTNPGYIPSPSYPSYPSYPCNVQQPSLPYDPYRQTYPSYSGYFQRRQDTVNVSELEQYIPSFQNVTVTSPVLRINPQTRNKRNLGYSYDKPSIPFAEGDVEVISASQRTQPNSRVFGGNCQSRLFFDWLLASKEVILRNVRCERYGIPNIIARSDNFPSDNDDNENSSECQEINALQGIITSPFYPNNYPNNIRICYRFNQAPSFCKIKIHIKDFEIEPSQDCVKDYLSFGTDNRKYCGRSLNDSKITLDFTGKNTTEIYFISDAQVTGKGFDISFSQQPCQETINY